MGIEKPSQEIIVRLVEERRRVVSIVGPGGSGKTTLAKQVYEKIKGQFSCVAFVSVSQKPNMNNLLRELQFQTGVPTSMAMGSCSDQLLIDQLRSYLENKRLVYLFLYGLFGTPSFRNLRTLWISQCTAQPLIILILYTTITNSFARRQSKTKTLKF